ncbi:glycosyltransferase [Xanthomarina sp. F2636L]|uniref:glycosyltransferase n=1 Tax=Xanthomarina sp. F2636L TaxID=2996018 RepID=UPI00225DD7B7|nr:glycosyltransferase [Xanthomarina sp. F2636L]MCX7550991.1 glycosyltransferase [Xanthomarina sp. F2636L]
MNKRILITPLNWGLGHATRCIPIINALIENKFTPVIASDGMALEILKKEFPNLEHFELPSYHIIYPKNKHLFKLKLLQHAPKLLKAIKAEKKVIANLIKTKHIHGIISDNRLGAFNKQIPSVFITHQLQVLSGNTTWFSSKLHETYIRRFDECWVPDSKTAPNLGGKLSHGDIKNLLVKYIGPLSRFSKKEKVIEYDIMVLLSGPEPQRSLFEKKLLEELEHYSGKVLFVRGVVEAHQTIEKTGNLTLYNFMTSNTLENSLNASKLILSRSGYTTIMDLAKLGKQAFFIPTPGQFEQEYLAKRLDRLQLVPSCKQDDFKLSKLEKTSEYKGLSHFEKPIDYQSLFSLFQTK